VPHNLILPQANPVLLLKFWMAPGLRLVISAVSKRKEPRSTSLSEAKPKLHTHREYGQRFHPLLHTSYIKDYWLAPLSEDVSSGYYVW